MSKKSSLARNPNAVLPSILLEAWVKMFEHGSFPSLLNMRLSSISSCDSRTANRSSLWKPDTARRSLRRFLASPRQAENCCRGERSQAKEGALVLLLQFRHVVFRRYPWTSLGCCSGMSSLMTDWKNASRGRELGNCGDNRFILSHGKFVHAHRSKRRRPGYLRRFVTGHHHPIETSSWWD